ncbi:hypothetical protein LMG7053_05242 [Achromobacter ruhlandii]|uniref:Peptidase S74 domain-containing protein n=1 Tax=Achromobacter ruhlandii TaxID=72557 RepID=A0ABM8M1V2_9BURK|nr:tail fiber domain-containing protein [Achromobacter ruhlandii]CAB3957284.1 hypothetical protein LMG7053_05242 [Achromobacter ruhlandii]
MGKGSSSTPEVPDYVAAAKATSQGNLDLAKYATQANRVNQITPWGSLTWSNGRTFNQSAYDQAMDAWRSQGGTNSAVGRDTSPYGYQQAGMHNGTGLSYVDWARQQQQTAGAGAGGMPNPQDYYSGDGDNWTQTVSLSPQMQALFDQNMKLQQGLFGAQDAALGRVNRNMASDLDTSGMQALGSVYDPTQATNTATEAILSRLNPELDRQYESLRTQLANQGITQGSAAYNNALNSFGQQRNDAVTQAGLQGITLGMQQQGQTFSQSAAKRAQQMQEAAYLRNLPLNELNALRSGSQVQMPEFPGYSQQATTSGPDYTGAAQNTYQSQLGASNAQAAGNSNMMSGLFGLGQLGMMGYGMGMFSDRRLKKNIKRIGTSEKKLGIYSFEYIFGGRHVGYMADEVARVSPHAVHDIGGLKLVDYAEV